MANLLVLKETEPGQFEYHEEFTSLAMNGDVPTPRAITRLREYLEEHHIHGRFRLLEIARSVTLESSQTQAPVTGVEVISDNPEHTGGDR